MNNQYHKDIVDLLIKCGQEGMSVGKIAQHIYNEHADFFACNVSFLGIYNTVRGYMWRQSRQRRSPFKRIGWGRYAVKPDFAVQLDFVLEMFRDDEETQAVRPGVRAVQLTFF